MKKTLLAAGLSLAALPALAQQAAQALPPPRVGVIDLGIITRDSQLGKSYAGRIDGLERALQAEIQKKQEAVQKVEAEIKALQDELEKQASVLSAEAADRKRQDLTRKGRERQALIEDGQIELQRMRERAQGQAEGLQSEFQQKIRPHIEAVAKEKGLDIIVQSQVALTMNPSYDISKDVIAKVDAAEKPLASAPAGAAPATAAASPAPAPAASPQP